MDDVQTNHLRAYGLAYWSLQQGHQIYWLLNYRAGSFLIPDDARVLRRAAYLGVYTEHVSDSWFQQLKESFKDKNMKEVLLEKAPKIAVYAPAGHEPWDDAVTLVLTYAEIPYDRIYDEEILAGKLYEYDWLHLHHEDFTGQFGKFYAYYKNAPWYIDQVNRETAKAKKLGFSSVAELKKKVAWEIREYVINGGFLFAMCAATDTLDIALAAQNVDIVPSVFDGTGVDPAWREKLDFSLTFMFRNFTLITDPMVYEYSNIDINPRDPSLLQKPYFVLKTFSAHEDPIPTLLTQNHTRVIKEFLGQTTAFRRELIKPTVIILGDTPGTDRVKYIFTAAGEGNVTYYAGHDPEDYQHLVGDPPTDLSLHPHSPGYRLILNNILFPAARKLKRKT